MDGQIVLPWRWRGSGEQKRGMAYGDMLGEKVLLLLCSVVERLYKGTAHGMEDEKGEREREMSLVGLAASGRELFVSGGGFPRKLSSGNRDRDGRLFAFVNIQLESISLSLIESICVFGGKILRLLSELSESFPNDIALDLLGDGSMTLVLFTCQALVSSCPSLGIMNLNANFIVVDKAKARAKEKAIVGGSKAPWKVVELKRH
ncbi:hypothetical protein Ancab_028806 [Ancistrocladus abbreviatus]